MVDVVEDHFEVLFAEGVFDLLNQVLNVDAM